MQRLAHAHEDEVAKRRAVCAQRALGEEDLGDDFAGAQMADESHLPRGAKHAAHRATSLRAHTNGVAARVAHDDGLDGLRIVEAEEKFARESVGTRGVGDDCGRVGEKARVVSDIRIHPSAERREKVGALGKITRRLAV